MTEAGLSTPCICVDETIGICRDGSLQGRDAQYS